MDVWQNQVRQTLERIYREHRQGLYTLALSVTRDPHRAEDAVHEAFVRLCRASVRLEGDATAYVFAAVRNAARDERRRGRTAEGRTASIFAPGDGGGVRATAASAAKAGGDGSQTPVAAVIGAETLGLVRAAVDALPDPARETVVMRLYAGLKFEQIAQAMDEPLGTITSRYQRAIRTIRGQLNGRL